ncbi:unnamed protein product [Amoebophrya sp. A120]|nr:unnamed protein product [Amoebophrya sp. A120]|eukprot:GSA120T00007196001.1
MLTLSCILLQVKEKFKKKNVDLHITNKNGHLTPEFRLVK